MSTSSVLKSQGLQSCLADPPVIHLKLTHPPPLPAAIEGLSFLQALAGAPANSAPAKVYVHPMVRRSAAALSAKSLEMCTESLGSETGGGDEMSMLAMDKLPTPPTRQKPAVACAARISRSVSFPPPMASVSGSAGLRFRSHRENGRLVLKAVVVEAPVSCFHAERGNGRLRLRLREFSAEESEAEEEVGEEDGVENEVKSDDEDEEEEAVSDEEELEAEGVEREKSGNVGVKRGKGKLEGYKSQNQRRRCKEDGCGKKNRVLMNCNQPYMVAT